MTQNREVRVPKSWCISLNTKPFESTQLKEGIIEWCVKTGVASKDLAQKTVAQLHPFLYMNVLFPKVDTSDPFTMKLWEINCSLIVAGYIMDDVLENYSLTALEDVDLLFRSTEAWMSKLHPGNYPNLDKISESISEINVPYSRAVISMFLDNFNQYCFQIWNSNNASLLKVSQFRKRLSASVTAYLEMAMTKKRGEIKIDEKEFLWQRSADNLGFPVLMLTEVLSALLQKECANIPVITLHYYHMYSNLFAHVLNDLNSYHRDLNTDHNSLVKLWMKNGVATDIDDAAEKIVQFLNAIVINMYKTFKKIQTNFPGCLQLQNFIKGISHTFVGWILVHTTVVERYRLSPQQTTMIEVETDGVEEWLESDSAFGKRCVQMFEELMQERNNEMIVLYGLD